MQVFNVNYYDYLHTNIIVMIMLLKSHYADEKNTTDTIIKEVNALTADGVIFC